MIGHVRIIEKKKDGTEKTLFQENNLIVNRGHESIIDALAKPRQLSNTSGVDVSTNVSHYAGNFGVGAMTLGNATEHNDHRDSRHYTSVTDDADSRQSLLNPIHNSTFTEVQTHSTAPNNQPNYRADMDNFVTKDRFLNQFVGMQGETDYFPNASLKDLAAGVSLGDCFTLTSSDYEGVAYDNWASWVGGPLNHGSQVCAYDDPERGQVLKISPDWDEVSYVPGWAFNPKLWKDDTRIPTPNGSEYDIPQDDPAYVDSQWFHWGKIYVVEFWARTDGTDSVPHFGSAPPPLGDRAEISLSSKRWESDDLGNPTPGTGVWDYTVPYSNANVTISKNWKKYKFIQRGDRRNIAYLSFGKTTNQGQVLYVDQISLKPITDVMENHMEDWTLSSVGEIFVYKDEDGLHFDRMEEYSQQGSYASHATMYQDFGSLELGKLHKLQVVGNGSLPVEVALYRGRSKGESLQYYDFDSGRFTTARKTKTLTFDEITSTKRELDVQINDFPTDSFWVPTSYTEYGLEVVVPTVSEEFGDVVLKEVVLYDAEDDILVNPYFNLRNTLLDNSRFQYSTPFLQAGNQADALKLGLRDIHGWNWHSPKTSSTTPYSASAEGSVAIANDSGLDVLEIRSSATDESDAAAYISQSVYLGEEFNDPLCDPAIMGGPCYDNKCFPKKVRALNVTLEARNYVSNSGYTPHQFALSGEGAGLEVSVSRTTSNGEEWYAFQSSAPQGLIQGEWGSVGSPWLVDIKSYRGWEFLSRIILLTGDSPGSTLYTLYIRANGTAGGDFASYRLKAVDFGPLKGWEYIDFNEESNMFLSDINDSDPSHGALRLTSTDNDYPGTPFQRYNTIGQSFTGINPFKVYDIVGSLRAGRNVTAKNSYSQLIYISSCADRNNFNLLEWEADSSIPDLGCADFNFSHWYAGGGNVDYVYDVEHGFANELVSGTNQGAKISTVTSITDSVTPQKDKTYRFSARTFAKWIDAGTPTNPSVYFNIYVYDWNTNAYAKWDFVNSLWVGSAGSDTKYRYRVNTDFELNTWVQNPEVAIPFDSSTLEAFGILPHPSNGTDTYKVVIKYVDAVGYRGNPNPGTYPETYFRNVDFRGPAPPLNWEQRRYYNWNSQYWLRSDNLTSSHRLAQGTSNVNNIANIGEGVRRMPLEYKGINDESLFHLHSEWGYNTTGTTIESASAHSVACEALTLCDRAFSAHTKNINHAHNKYTTSETFNTHKIPFGAVGGSSLLGVNYRTGGDDIPKVGIRYGQSAFHTSTSSDFIEWHLGTNQANQANIQLAFISSAKLVDLGLDSESYKETLKFAFNMTHEAGADAPTSYVSTHLVNPRTHTAYRYRGSLWSLSDNFDPSGNRETFLSTDEVVPPASGQADWGQFLSRTIDLDAPGTPLSEVDISDWYIMMCCLVDGGSTLHATDSTNLHFLNPRFYRNTTKDAYNTAKFLPSNADVEDISIEPLREEDSPGEFGHFRNGIEFCTPSVEEIHLEPFIQQGAYLPSDASKVPNTAYASTLNDIGVITSEGFILEASGSRSAYIETDASAGFIASSSAANKVAYILKIPTDDFMYLSSTAGGISTLGLWTVDYGESCKKQKGDEFGQPPFFVSGTNYSILDSHTLDADSAHALIADAVLSGTMGMTKFLDTFEGKSHSLSAWFYWDADGDKTNSDGNLRPEKSSYPSIYSNRLTNGSDKDPPYKVPYVWTGWELRLGSQGIPELLLGRNSHDGVGSGSQILYAYGHMGGLDRIMPSRWYHLAATYDINTNLVKLYVDGELSASEYFQPFTDRQPTATYHRICPAYGPRICRHSAISGGTAGQEFGTTQIGVWNTALTPEEVGRLSRSFDAVSHVQNKYLQIHVDGEYTGPGGSNPEDLVGNTGVQFHWGGSLSNADNRITVKSAGKSHSPHTGIYKIGDKESNPEFRLFAKKVLLDPLTISDPAAVDHVKIIWELEF